METTPSVNAKVDKHGRQVSQHCLGLPTVLRQILQLFPNDELLRLSLVNKLWNFEARSLLRKRGNLRANSLRIGGHEGSSCQKLVALASALEGMPVVPFTGLHIPIYHCGICVSASNGSLHPACSVVLDRLPWKHFSVQFYEDWENCNGCPALLLVEKLFEDYCGVVEELSLRLGKEKFLRTIFSTRSWSCLKILKVEKNSFGGAPEHLTNGFIKTMVSCAPNLQELHVEGDNDFTDNILEGSSAGLVPHDDFRPLFHQVCDSLVGSFRAKTLEILIQEREINPELLNRFIPKLLQESRTSLKTLRMDLLFAVPLMCYGVCLENVATLEIHMNFNMLAAVEPPIRMLPTALYFTRIFPKLTQVKIVNNDTLWFSYGAIDAFVEQATAVLGRALPDRALNIKLLDLDRRGTIDNSNLQLLAQMFPDVKKVHTTMRGREGTLFADLREHFLCLEEVI